MPDARRAFSSQTIEPNGSNVELFAQALDDLVHGNQSSRIDNAPLASLATAADRLQRTDGVIQTAHGPVSATRIDRDRRQRIWEDLMTGSARQVAGLPAVPPRAGSAASMNPWVEDEEPASRWSQIVGPRRHASSTGVLRLIPDIQPTTTFLMVIALLIAIGAGFSSLGQPGGPGITPTASATGDRGIAAGASSGVTPEADAAFLRPGSSQDCTVDPRPVEEVTAFRQDPGPVSERAYLPVTNVDAAVAEFVAQTGRTYVACGRAGQDYTRALETPRRIYEDPSNSSFLQAGGGFTTISIDEQKKISDALIDPYWRTYVIPSNSVWTSDQAEAAIAAGEPAQVTRTMLPSHMVRLPDGRVGGPVFTLIHPEEADYPPDLQWGGVNFLIFAPDVSRGGQWAVDERLTLCSGDCTDFWESSSGLDPASAEAGPCPVAPLTSEQTAAIRDRESTLPDRQYAPVTTADVPTAHDVRSVFGVMERCTAEMEGNPLYAYALSTDRFIKENPLGISPMGQIERSQAISERYGDALLGDQPSDDDLDFLLNIYAAQDHSLVSDIGLIGATDQHPRIVRLLPDGRAAVYSADVWLNRTGRIRVPTPVPGREVFFYTIFANQNGSWLLDESLVICLGDCDSLWAEMSTAPATPAGTPAASPEAALPTAKRE